MRCNTPATAAVILVILCSGCSTFNKVVYRPDITQGNYLTPISIAKIRKGMTKEQVAYTLGTPMLQDPFGNQTWFYIFRQQPSNKDITQQTLTLTFNSEGILTDIQNKLELNK
ncbi:Outer membrane protein assembly factor BamE [Serratia symbiotica]|nr:Outer membrane protein assembly factor BamE [Serratia symbiotica]